jgi:uncharacterized membrane protein
MDNKFILKSKTILGAILTFAIAILPQFGISFTGDDAALFARGIDQLAILATTAFTVYGRVAANTKVTGSL